MRKNLLLEKAVRLLLSTFAFLLFISSLFIKGQGTETFENIPTSSSTTYSTRTWNGVNATSWSATDARTDVTITTKAITIRNGSLTFGLTAAQKAAGIGSLTLKAKAPYGNPDVGTLQLVVNGTVISAKTTTGATISTVVSYTWSDINVSTLTSIVINQTTQNSRIAIDDISWTAAPASGSAAPTLNAAASATVDAPFDVTFTDDATWRGAITGVTVGGTALTAGYSVSSGKITFTPSASVPANLLQSSGTKSIVINATGYSGATVSQTIGVGAPAKLAMNTQPAAPSTNGGALATQPKVNIVDQYGNTTTSTASVTAAVGAGTWTLGGTTSVAAVSGTSTFSGLTATSAAAVTGATITFSSGSLTPVTSSTFNIPTPPPANDDCSGAINLTVNAAAVSGTFAGATPMTGASKNDVFFMFTPSVTGSYTITINGFSVASDKDFYVYSVCPNTYSTTTNVVVSGATTSTSSETAKATFTAGTSYKILVQDYGSGGGAFNISVTSPIITGGTTAAPFTTTYGTASAAQNFAVSGSGLSANLVATAPTGFEVSADGNTYGNTATFTQTSGSASGTLSIRLKANAAVTGNYNAQNIVLSSTGATSVNITTAASGNSVSTKALTITANNRTKTYGTTLTLGTSEFTSSGLANSETIGSVTLSAAGAASTATTAVGTYPITPSAATGGTFTASNYAITYVDGTLTINKADQTITFGQLSAKTYGDASFDLTGTSSSGLGLTYSSSDTNVATVSGSTVTIVGAGSTTITASQAGDGNHNAATSVDQVLTINKKSLTITGLSAENKTFDGTTAATLTGTPVLNGVVGSDDVSLTGTPTATFASSSVGHAIAVTVSGYSLTGAKAGDYQLVEPTLSADIIATTPTLFANGTLSALTTTYGTPSTTTSFTVSGQSLTDVITITAPTGFEVSSTSSTTGFANEISIPQVSGSVAATTIYVRLSSAAKPVNSPFSGDIVIKSTDATTLTVATSTSTVSKKELTVTGLTGVDKIYNGTTTATVSGTAALSGIVNSDDVSISGTHEFTFADANVGTSKPITASGFTLSGTDAGNYTLAQPTGLTATISKADQTITAIATTVSKTFGDATYSIATTASSGLAVTYTSSNTAVATVAADGTVTIVGGGTATLTASQSGNGNYNAATSVTQALTVDKANQTITAITATMTKSYGDATYSIATTASSGLAVTYASSNTAVATVAANGTVTIVGVGSTTLTASQSGNGNYNAATSVTQELTVGKGNQTITLASTATKTTADAPYTLTQNASSGLAITYASSNPAVATISGNTVTIVGVGTTTITANQAGNENYNAAPQVTQTLTVTQGSTVLAGWDFFGQSSPATFAATTYNSNLNNSSSQSSLTRGTGAASSTGSNSFRTTGFQNNGISTSNTDYFEVKMQSVSGKKLTLTKIDANLIGTSSFYATPGVTSQFAYSLDGTNFTLIGSPLTTTSLSISFDLSAVSALQNVPSDKTVTIRYYASGQTNTGGWGFSSPTSGTNGLAISGYTESIPAPVITSSLTASGKVGTSFNYNITASNTPSSYSATGLPTGLSINATTGVISGTPTVAGNFDVTIGATNPTGTGTKTLVLTIAKADQTITFGSLSAKTYGDSSFALTGTSSSGLGLTYSSSDTNVATVSGSTVTIVGTGSITITASQSGDDNHNAATSVDQVLTINKKSLTIKGLSAENKTFDGTTAATLTGTPVLNGVVGSDDVSLTGTPTATFASSSVGHAIAVTVSGYSLTGAKAGDYQLVEPTLSADIIATVPTLFVNGTLSALTTTYGTASTTTSFTVSGQSLTDVITITAPTGFEVSSTSSTTGFANEISIPQVSGSVAATTIYVRLSSAAKPVNSPFSGDIVIKSTDATTLTVATSTSTVSKKELTVTGLTGVDKIYNGTTTATVSGTAALSGIVNSDDVSISGTHVFTFADANAGTSKPITASGFTLSGTDAGNYTLAQPTGLTATISKADQTIVAIESTVTKTYGDATYSIATTASSGLAVTYASSNTAVATVAANGTVTIVGVGSTTLTASQSGNGNYNAATSVTQALTVDKANQTITAITATMTKSYGDATYSIATTASSGLAVTYASSNTAVATVAANGTVTIVGVGSTTLTALQSGNGNYNAATSVTQELTVGKGNQTITLASTATKTTADAPYTLTQNASSGLVITYASSNPAVATISGNTVTIVGVGTTTITANQAGNENYNAAPEATQTLTVTLPPKVILKWNTYGNSGTETTEDSSFNVDGLSNSTLNYVGSTVTPAGNSNRFGGTNWAIGSLSTTKYIQFTVTPADGFTFTPTSFDFIWDFSSSGPKSVTLRSSVDNYTSDIGTITNMSASTSVFKTISISGINDVVAPVTFRLYGYDATSTSGTGGFDVGSNIDNVILKGFVNLLPPVITSSLTASGKVGTSFNYNVTASNTPSSYSATGLPTGLSINSNSGLISGTPTEAGNFDVTIGATNAAGTDAKTLVINIAKGDQTITFASLTDKLDTVGTFTLSATASSGLNVTYTSSNTSVLTIAGNVATVLAPGVTTITALQAGDDNYNAATDVSQDQKIVDSTITVWDGTAWSNGEPTSSLKAILDGDYDGSSFESQTLTVNTGKTLTVNSFVKTGNVTNNGNIIVANNANFLQIGSFTSGDGASFKVRKDTKAVKRLAYMNWSSPMANSSQTLKQFSYGKNANGTAQSSTGTLDNRFYTYNNNAYVLTAPSGTFTKGQGYLIRTPNDFTTTPQIFHAQFEGTIPNAGTITYDHSSLQGNFILLGNPYPSAISYDDFMIQNTNTTGTVYVWNSQVEMVNNQYAGTIYNTFTSAGANPANSLDAYIPVGQGFFVQRTNNDPFVFTDAMRRTTEMGVTSKSSTVSKNRFWLELASPSGAKPQMLLGFFPGTTKGIDKGYDAILLDATTETLYSTVEDKKLIIDAHGGFDEADEFSLSANLTTGGNYTISLLQKEGIFSNGQKIYLKDNLTGAVTDLTTNKYEFTETTGLKSNRFTLQFKPSGVLGTQDLAKEELNIISVGKEVRIKAGQNVATVEIYDLTGKKLIKVQPHQRETVINLSTEGMIVVKVTLQNGREKSKKLIIK